MEQPTSRCDLRHLDSVEDYKAALKACRPLFKSKKYLELLKANYYAPRHAATAGELADAVGYKNWNAANLQYGAFAGEMIERLGRRKGRLEGVGMSPTFDVAILVTFSGGSATGEHVRWTLVPPLVQALEAMRWVKAS